MIRLLGQFTLAPVMWSGAVRLVERRVIRRRWLTTVMLVVVLAISAGATMAAVAGARRASTSYDRFIEWSDGSQVVIAGSGPDSSEEADANLTRLASLSGVEDSTRSVFLGDEVAIDGEVLPFRTIMPIAFGGRIRRLDGRGHTDCRSSRRASPGPAFTGGLTEPVSAE